MTMFLADALESVVRQRAHVKEILLTEAGSGGESASVVASFRARGLPIALIETPDASPDEA
jgi:hypothetical protein